MKLYFRFMKRHVLLFFLLYSFGGQAQECDRVWLKGRVIDSLNPTIFLNLMVVNISSGKGVFGQPDGRYAVYVAPNDSIVLSVKGYERVGFRAIPDSTCQLVRDFEIEHIGREIGEVIIKPLKTIQQIKEERANLTLRETRTITGIEAIQSPITALYQRFSQKEQSKQRVAEMEYKDSQAAILQELLRLYVVYDIIALSPDEFEEFISFLAINEDFLKTATDMELVTFIKDKFEHYKALKTSN
jgi:hypothetical protein